MDHLKLRLRGLSLILHCKVSLKDKYINMNKIEKNTNKKSFFKNIIIINLIILLIYIGIAIYIGINLVNTGFGGIALVGFFVVLVGFMGVFLGLVKSRFYTKLILIILDSSLLSVIIFYSELHYLVENCSDKGIFLFEIFCFSLGILFNGLSVSMMIAMIIGALFSMGTKKLVKYKF